MDTRLAIFVFNLFSQLMYAAVEDKKPVVIYNDENWFYSMNRKKI